MKLNASAVLNLADKWDSEANPKKDQCADDPHETHVIVESATQKQKEECAKQLRQLVSLLAV